MGQIEALRLEAASLAEQLTGEQTTDREIAVALQHVADLLPDVALLDRADPARELEDTRCECERSEVELPTESELTGYHGATFCSTLGGGSHRCDRPGYHPTELQPSPRVAAAATDPE